MNKGHLGEIKSAFYSEVSLILGYWNTPMQDKHIHRVLFQRFYDSTILYVTCNFEGANNDGLF